jgi:hypothetical protein
MSLMIQTATFSDPHAASDSRAALWAGRAISALVVAFMLFDAGLHLFKPAPVVAAFAQLGFPLGLSVALGIIELACVVLYVVPRTAVLGAILLTGYLGGAIAIQMRVGNPLFGETLFPLYVGILVWGGLFLRDQRLGKAIPLPTLRGTNPVSKKALWAGRVVSVLPALMLLFAGFLKLLMPPAVAQGFAQYGLAENLIAVVGILELSCAVVYLIPQTAVLGAILMTGLLGGATATNVRVGNPSFVVTIVLGVLVWLGLYLRDHGLRALVPFRG